MCCTPELRSRKDLQKLIMISNPCLANIHSASTEGGPVSPVVEAGGTGLFAVGQGELQQICITPSTCQRSATNIALTCELDRRLDSSIAVTKKG